jgi:hypothetical protein
MINMQEAVRAARDFAGQMYSEGELKKMRVEEIESSEDEKRWFITLGWAEEAVQQVGAFATNATLERVPRVYKTFVVDANDGHVVSMKMRG